MRPVFRIGPETGNKEMSVAAKLDAAASSRSIRRYRFD